MLTAMNVAYASCYEAVFVCSHSEGLKMSYAVAAKYMAKSKSFVANTMKKPLFGEKDVSKRLANAKENLDRDWSDMILTDEASGNILSPDVAGQP
ncbi:hypothetical protein Trydic_g1498 [Trypoxylus dichotomus]